MKNVNKVCYEFPCNEKIRMCLRLEKSIQRMQYFIEQDNEVAALAAFNILFDLIELTTRPDLRKDLVQELQRVRAVLQNQAIRPDFSEEMTQTFIEKLVEAIDGLTKPNPAIRSIQSLRDNDWLNTVRARSQMAGGNCTFDLPSLHYWLAKPFEERHARFIEWLQGTIPIKKAVDTILEILRATTEYRTVYAKSGSVNLPVPSPCGWSLIQIAIPSELAHIPEVSVNKFMLWIHFLDMTPSMKTPPSRADIEFELALCGI